MLSLVRAPMHSLIEPLSLLLSTLRSVSRVSAQMDVGSVPVIELR